MSILKEKTVEIFLYLAVFLNLIFWFYARDFRAEWHIIPPVPSESRAQSFAIGDRQLAFRMISVMLQNFGDTGGRVTPLEDYDFDDLTRWLRLSSMLDPESSFTPYLAALYFGGVQKPSMLPPLLEYLSDAGQRPGGENWRWLAHAAYLARFRMKNMDLALKYARQLAALPGDQPVWTRQMPGFILNSTGNKDEALEIMVKIIKEGLDKYDPAEITHTRDTICERILDPEEAAVHPLCKDVPQQ